MNVQHWPADGQFVNKEIPHFGWMEMIFGACPDGPGNLLHAETVKRAISKAKSGGSSKKAVQDDSDDDFMPPKRANSRRKLKSVGASKTVVDENSDDDFMPPTRARGRGK